MAKVGISRKSEKSELKDGSGAVVYTESTLTNWEFKCDFLQSDKDTYNFFDDAESKQYLMIYERGTINGKKQYWIFGPSKLSGDISSDFDDFAQVNFVLSGQKNSAAITCTSLPTGVTLFTSFEIPIEKQKIILEVP
jgi:hypothetical protein